jgi:Rrf2 family protein
MINATAEYALRAVVFLATGHDKPVSREAISEQTKIPTDYLVRVLMSLDEAGIVSSQRGRGGGYQLCESAGELTVYDVIAAVTALPRTETCPLGIEDHIDLCPLHARLNDVAGLVEDAYRQTLISELIPEEAKKKGCDFPGSKGSM